jgi:hypothetical protein
MKSYNINNLTEEQLRLIIEALLFSASTTVNARWYSEEDESLKNMALNLRKEFPEVLTKNISIIEEEEYYDEFAPEIIDLFPEILEQMFIL